MKKHLFVTLAVLLIAGLACAQSDLTDEDYKNLDQLHNKLIRMKKEMDRLMKDVISTYPQGEGAFGGYGQDVKVDIVETDKEMIVKADLPGMEKDRIDITLEKSRLLKIAGKRDVLKQVTAPGVVRQERSSGRFERTVELPSEGLTDGIKANYQNGVLEIVIPKKKSEKEEKVTIRVQ